MPRTMTAAQKQAFAKRMKEARERKAREQVAASKPKPKAKAKQPKAAAPVKEPRASAPRKRSATDTRIARAKERVRAAEQAERTAEKLYTLATRNCEKNPTPQTQKQWASYRDRLAQARRRVRDAKADLDKTFRDTVKSAKSAMGGARRPSLSPALAARLKSLGI